MYLPKPLVQGKSLSHFRSPVCHIGRYLMSRVISHGGSATNWRCSDRCRNSLSHYRVHYGNKPSWFSLIRHLLRIEGSLLSLIDFTQVLSNPIKSNKISHLSENVAQWLICTPVIFTIFGFRYDLALTLSTRAHSLLTNVLNWSRRLIYRAW